MDWKVGKYQQEKRKLSSIQLGFYSWLYNNFIHSSDANQKTDCERIEPIALKKP